MTICPVICSFYYLACALMHDVACEFACAVGCAETISANVLKVSKYKVFKGYTGIYPIVAFFNLLDQVKNKLLQQCTVKVAYHSFDGL